MTHWHERDPERLASETAAWADHGFTRTISSDGLVVFHGTVTHDSIAYRVRVEYPQGFPYERPAFFLPDVKIKPEDRHRTLLDGVLCLRGYLPDQWDHTEQGVDLLPNLHTWLHGHLTGEWPNEHQAVDMSFLRRTSMRSALIDPGFQRPMPENHGALPVTLYAHQNNVVFHVTDNPMMPRRAHRAAAYLRLPHVPLRLGEAYRQSATGGVRPGDVINALEAEFPDVHPRRSIQAILAVPKHWKEGTLLALQFPLVGEAQPRWVWEVLILHPKEGLLPIHVNYTNDLFNRVRHELDTTTLHDARVAVLGMGSLGATVALELAKAGVGTLTLLDMDQVSIGNLTRHRATIKHLGMPKTSAVKDLITEHIPNITVNAGLADGPLTNLFQHYDELLTVAEQHDVIAVCVGNDNLHQYLNKIFLTEQARAVYAWVYLDAAAGRVVRVLPGTTGCMTCLNHWIKDNCEEYGITPRIPEDINRLPLDYGCNTPAVPGSGFDTDRVALAQARTVLQLLLGNNANYPYDEDDHRLIINRPIPMIAASTFETSRSWPLPPHERCTVCKASAVAA